MSRPRPTKRSVYYLAAQRRVVGTTDPETIAFLYAAFMHQLPIDHVVSAFDGTTLFDDHVFTVLYEHGKKFELL